MECFTARYGSYPGKFKGTELKVYLEGIFVVAICKSVFFMTNN